MPEGLRLIGGARLPDCFQCLPQPLFVVADDHRRDLGLAVKHEGGGIAADVVAGSHAARLTLEGYPKGDLAAPDELLHLVVGVVPVDRDDFQFVGPELVPQRLKARQLLATGRSGEEPEAQDGGPAAEGGERKLGVLQIVYSQLRRGVADQVLSHRRQHCQQVRCSHPPSGVRGEE